MLETQTEVGKQSPLVFRSCYDRWRWLKHPLSGSSRSLEFGRRQNFRKQLRSGNGTQFDKSSVLSPDRNFGVAERTSSRRRSNPKKQTSTTVTGKTVSFSPRFRTRGRSSAVLSRDPNTGSSKTDHQRSIIINLIQSNPEQGSDRISYPILSIPEAARTIIAYPIWA